MTPTTAQAVLEYVKRFNVPAKPNVDESEGVIKVWLRAIGWKEDNWGNFLEPGEPKIRYHFKKTQLNKQRKDDRGDWVNSSYTSSIDSALSLIVSAAGVIGDQEVVAKYAKSKGKRREQKQSRAESAEEKRQRSEATSWAWKEYASQRRGFAEKMLQGKAKDEEVLKAREEFTPMQAKWLQVVKDGKTPEDDQQFATADSPPVLPVLGTAEYKWTETVDGVEYSVKIESVEKNVAEISIGGDIQSHGIGVSAITHAIRVLDSDAKGDSYIAGKISYRDDRYQAALFMIMSGSKQKGAGSRALSIWCRLMSGYGVKAWVAEAVGVEGEAFLLALEKKGKLKIHVRQGPNWALECLSGPAQNPIDKNTKLPKGYSYSKTPIHESEIRVGDTVEMAAPDKFNVSYGYGSRKVLKKGRVNVIVESFYSPRPDFEQRMELKVPLAHIENVLRGKVVYRVDHSKKNPSSRLLILGPGRVDTSATESLRRMKKLAAKNHGDQESAVISAGYYAKKLNETMYVYPGTSYGSGVWRVSSKRSDYLDPINNNGPGRIPTISVTPDLVVSLHDTKRSEPQSNPTPAPKITLKQAQDIGKKLGVDWERSLFDADQFRMGMQVEMEHGDRHDVTNLTGDDFIETGMIALAHLLELDTYYYLLDDMEKKGKRQKKARKNPAMPASNYRLSNIGEIGGWTVWTVRGGLIRDSHQEFVCGGNHGRYVWIPKTELWVEPTDTPADTASNAFHEAVEFWHMERGMGYEPAHKIANLEEKRFRKESFSGKAGNSKITLSRAMTLAQKEFENWRGRQKNPSSKSKPGLRKGRKRK